MRKLIRLWRTLEGIHGLAAIRAYWEYYCGVDYLIVQPFLRATDLTGATYPCQEQCIPGCYREIVDYGDGEIVAVCRYRWFQRLDIPLTRPDTVLQQLDIAAFAKAIARPLGFRWQNPVERGHGAWAIGFAGNGCGVEQPVILLMHSEQDRFRVALHRLLAESPGQRFFLLAPTSRYKDLEVHEALGRHGIRFHSLEEQIGIDDAGRFVAIQPLVQRGSDVVSVTPISEQAEGPEGQQTAILKSGRPLPRSIGSKAAINAVIAFMRAKGLSQTQLAILAQTNERTIRKFLKTGKIRRSTFEDIAAGMGVTKDQLLRGELSKD